MGRIILILTAGCLLATFMIISNASFKRTTSAYNSNEDLSKKAEKARPRKPEQSARAKITTKAETNGSQRSSETKSKEISVGAAVTEEEGKSRDADAALVIVKDENTPVYSVNSRQSNVVGLLKKGDRVTPEMEVLDEKGRWTIVRKRELNKPGFVLDANLQRANTSKKTDK